LGVKYLADQYLVSYSQSATTLAMRRAKPPSNTGAGSVLLVCDPVFSSSDPRAEKMPVLKTDGGEEDGLSLKKMGALQEWGAMGVSGTKEKGQPALFRAEELFPRLEKTRGIALTASSLFGEKKTVVLSGADANEQKITGTDLTGFKYVIFATHGILDNTVPWIREPALVLNQQGNKPPYDGFLTMTEILKLKIPAELVLLLACRTGIGENVTGEGVMGLGRAFQFAGCGGTVMSLWSVSEDATVALTGEMLKNLNDGMGPDKALKAAKDTIRRNGWEHPFYWSAFVIY
jgi:CHAT domain-containing protein